MSQQVYSKELFKDEVLIAGGTATSVIIDVNAIHPLGQFATQLKIVGNGEVKVELYSSINGESFVPYVELWEEMTAGEYIENHAFVVATKLKIVITETGGNDGATVSLWLGVQ